MVNQQKLNSTTLIKWVLKKTRYSIQSFIALTMQFRHLKLSVP